MSASMRRITISVPETMAERLDAVAGATDRSVSSLIRQALRLALPDEDQSAGILHPVVRAAAMAQREAQIQQERADIAEGAS